MTVDDPAFRQVVGRHLEIDPVAWKNPDAVAAQAAGDVGEDDVSVIELHRKGRAGEDLLDISGNLERGLLEVLLGFGFRRARGVSRASVTRRYC